MRPGRCVLPFSLRLRTRNYPSQPLRQQLILAKKICPKRFCPKRNEPIGFPKTSQATDKQYIYARTACPLECEDSHTFYEGTEPPSKTPTTHSEARGIIVTFIQERVSGRCRETPTARLQRFDSWGIGCLRRPPTADMMRCLRPWNRQIVLSRTSDTSPNCRLLNVIEN